MIPEKTKNQKCETPEFHGTVTVGSKGQIVIPKHIRKDFGIQPGDRLMAITKGNLIFGFIKSDDMPKIKKYLEQEMKNC